MMQSGERSVPTQSSGDNNNQIAGRLTAGRKVAPVPLHPSTQPSTNPLILDQVKTAAGRAPAPPHGGVWQQPATASFVCFPCNHQVGSKRLISPNLVWTNCIVHEVKSIDRSVQTKIIWWGFKHRPTESVWLNSCRTDNTIGLCSNKKQQSPMRPQPSN